LVLIAPAVAAISPSSASASATAHATRLTGRPPAGWASPRATWHPGSSGASTQPPSGRTVSPREGTLAALGLDERVLLVVARLSQRWGVEAGYGTSSVWAEIDRSTRSPHTAAKDGEAAPASGEEEPPLGER
jgi:hypothetical protein